MMDTLSDSQLQAWRLFIIAHARLINKIDAQLEAASKIPLHWYDVLIELYEADNRRLRMYDLAERVVLSRSGLTRLVDRLEKAGLLKREMDPKDRRGYYVVITEAGIQALRESWPIYAAGIREHFAHYLTEEDASTFIRVFTAMLEAADHSD